MRSRSALFAVILVAVAGLGPMSPSTAAPANPGNTKNCEDFPGWNEAQVWYETYYPYYGDVARLDADGDRVPCEANHGAPDATQWAPRDGGYLMLESNGTVFGFGDLRPLQPALFASAVSLAMGPNGGYWILTADGGVHSRGASWYGNAAVPTGDRATTIAGLPDGSGYWVFTDRGRAIPFGNARHYGDMSGTALNGPVIASVPTPSGLGYWMIASDGGVFSFGDARFHGSTGNLRLNEPVVGVAADPDGEGYWLVAADGGIFAFDAPFRGSIPEGMQPGRRLNKPVVGALAYGDGYLMVAADGGIFSFSNRPFFGSLGNTPPPNPILSVGLR